MRPYAKFVIGDGGCCRCATSVRAAICIGAPSIVEDENGMHVRARSAVKRLKKWQGHRDSGAIE